jgi:hypothetical protein
MQSPSRSTAVVVAEGDVRVLARSRPTLRAAAPTLRGSGLGVQGYQAAEWLRELPGRSRRGAADASHAGSDHVRR